jgi:nicotinic acid mononucleotide adenylyltransferase/nicotinamide mononucleotide (NMN) deamidase PncC
MEDRIMDIHRSPFRIVLAITGGGTEAIGELLRHGGGSDTLLEAIIPYSNESLHDLIGKEPASYASAETAKDMAMSAYRRALFLDTGFHKDPLSLIGIGVTCKLVKQGPEREGRQHEVYFASQSYDRSTVSGISLKMKGCREEQERIVANYILERIASLCDPKKYAGHNIRENNTGEKTLILENEAEADHAVSELLLKTLESINSGKNTTPMKANLGVSSSKPGIIMSGSFNPCHKNHIEMAMIASEKYGMPVDFEISLANVDKPPIDYISLKERLESLRSCMQDMKKGSAGNIYLSNSPLFADKAILFPGSVFLIGTDTLNRLFNIDYYRKGEDMQSLIEHFKNHNTRFLVFRRKDADICNEMDIPNICEMVSCDCYTDDGTSSTKIRNERSCKFR